VTFAFVLDSSANGRIIEYDDTSGQGSRGSGVLRKANPSAFSLSALNGSWVYGTSGNDHGDRDVQVGQLTLNSGNITNGTNDENDGGTLKTGTFTGTMSSVNSQTGRATMTVQSTQGTAHEVVYVVSTGETVMANTDFNGPPIQVGSVLQQSGPFNNGSLNGTTVMYSQDIHSGDGLDQSDAGVISFAGNGNFNLLAIDEDTGGTITQQPPGPGNYTVAANGAINLGAGNPAGFLIGQNHGFFVGTGSNSIFGTIEPQTGVPFSNASIAGTYAAGSLAPLDYANGSNEVDVGPADGLGTLTLNGDYSQSDGLGQSLGAIVTYSITSNGRGTAEAQGDPGPAVVYVISPTKWIVLLPRTDARVLVFGH
jgi:hypothetical protein